MMRNFLRFNSNVRRDIITGVKNNFTIQFYVKPTTSIALQTQSSSGTLGTNANPYLLMPLSSGTEAGLGVAVGTNGIMVVESANNYAPCVCVHSQDLAEKWSWVTVVVTNRTATLWIDGVKVKVGNTSGKSTVLLNGSLGGGTWGSYNGGLTELTFWDRPLQEEEIAQGVKKGVYHLSEGLVRYYRCDRGEGSVLVDSAKSENLDIGVDIWDSEEIVFTPYKAPNGSGIMYAYKSYKFANDQILHRGVKFKGKTAKGERVSLIGANSLEGVDIGDVTRKFYSEGVLLSFGERKKVDIHPLVQSTNGNEASVNKNVYNQLTRTFPPAKAFQSGSFDNYSFIIRQLKWGNANFLAFPTSAVQKIEITKGERVVTNDDMMIGDVRGYQLVQKNKTTEVVYGGLLEVYPKAKLVDIAYVTFLDRPVVFGGFNNIFAPEYEFNNGTDDDDGITRPPHAEVYDLYEDFENYTYSDALISIREAISVNNGGSYREEVTATPFIPYLYYDTSLITQVKVGDSFFYDIHNEEEYNLRQDLLTLRDDEITMRHTYGAIMQPVQSVEDKYAIYEVPFDIVDFKSIEQIQHDE